jgi:hypothetical protein
VQVVKLAKFGINYGFFPIAIIAQDKLLVPRKDTASPKAPKRIPDDGSHSFSRWFGYIGSTLVMQRGHKEFMRKKLN